MWVTNPWQDISHWQTSPTKRKKWSAEDLNSILCFGTASIIVEKSEWEYTAAGERNVVRRCVCMSERILKSCCFLTRFDFIKFYQEKKRVACDCREILQWADNSVTETQRFCSDLPRSVRVIFVWDLQ